VWAQVTGLRPARSVQRLLMALNFQAFMDESESSEEFVLGGYIATAETWAQFALDWERLLPFGTHAKNANRHFKMSEMAFYGKMADVQKFYAVIEKYDMIPVSYRMNMYAYRNAQERMKSFAKQMNWTIDWGLWSNTYYFSFRQFLHNFHLQRKLIEDKVPLTEKIDFYFDDRSESAPIMAAWSEIRRKLPEEVGKHFGANPRFEDDQEFLGLQAADLWSWWVRHWFEEDDYEMPDKMRNFDFDGWRGNKRKAISFNATERQLFEAFKAMALENLVEGNLDPMSRALYDFGDEEE
jgi:hypothetical protein